MHTFLALDMDLIPQWTKDNVPNFWDIRRASDNSRILIPAYNEQRKLVHVDEAFQRWLAGVPNKEEVFNQLMATGIEYTESQMIEETNNPDSVWYIAPVEDD